MSKRIVNIKGYKRKLKSGKVVNVKPHTRQVKSKYPPSKLSQISYGEANKAIIKNFKQHSADSKHTAKITFDRPNKLWAEDLMDETDVYKIDTRNIPVHTQMSASGLPGQIIQYGGKIFKATKEGKWEPHKPR